MEVLEYSLFYQQGWSGVAIDPNPDFAKLFAAERPRDVFLNMGISAIEGELIYHRFDESLLNTFSAEQAMSVMSKKDGIKSMRLRRLFHLRKLFFCLAEWSRNRSSIN